MDKFYRRMKPLLGTFVEIGIDPVFSNAEEAVSSAFLKISDIQKKLNFHDKCSELSILNNSSGNTVCVDNITAVVIRLAKAMTRASDHKFNCTVGTYFSNESDFPSQPLRQYGFANDIEIQCNHVTLKNGVFLILDGIAKGYAVDLAIKSLQKNGVKNGWVNAGGDLRVFGDITWPVQVRDVNGEVLEMLKIKNMAIATSNSAIESTERYTGKMLSSLASEPYLGSFTVIASSAWRADALTKVAANTSNLDRENVIRKLGGFLVPYKGV